MSLILHTAATPNCFKVTITLEELGLPYTLRPVDLLAGEQKSPAFLTLNPNGRVPVLVDDGFPIFESGAILIHIAETTGRLMPADPHGRSRVLQWLMFQMSGLGPTMAQANVFYRYLPERLPLAIERFQAEGRRLFEVMDRQLGLHPFLAGDYSIADIAAFAWVRTARWSGIEAAGLPNLARWKAEIAARPAVARGLHAHEGIIGAAEPPIAPRPAPAREA